MAALTPDQIAERLRELDGWSHEDNKIVREFRLDDFVSAVGVIAQIAVLAERANHHPTLTNTYNRVRVALSTHDEGGVTEKDFALAREIEAKAR